MKDSKLKETSIYIHIPFCDHKCIYCDFYSIIKHDDLPQFQKALLKEIEFYADKYSAERKIKSVFFGGGTPSLMGAQYIAEILKTISECYNICEDAEITLEANPGTVDENKLKSFYQSGVNRLSIGIQSFDEKDLTFLTRIHSAETAIATVKQAYSCGFNNINVDLIFNLPGQTKANFRDNLIIASELPITHISAYSLILEYGTILNKMVLDGKVEIQDEDYDAEIYEMTIEYLTSKGFIQYEVSNFAKAGFECTHNKAYWQYKDYLAFGPSGHGFVNGRRYWNRKSLRAYIKDIEEKRTAVVGEEFPTREEMLDEYIMLALRSNGLDQHKFQSVFGDNWLNEKEREFKKLEENGLLTFENRIIKLTSRGYAVCDELIMNLLK